MIPASWTTHLSGTNSICLLSHLTGTKLAHATANKYSVLETSARRVCCDYTWYYDF